MTDHQAFKSLTGKAPWSALHCTCCVPMVLPTPSNLKQHTTIPWAVSIHCPKCDSGWTVCTMCSSAWKRLPIYNGTVLHNHGKRHHPSKMGTV